VEKLPRVDLGSPPPGGSRQRLRALGPEEFARDLRRQTALAVTDTTFRDAHQSLLATRVRSRDLLAVAGHVARSVPELLSLEAWGGATYDVALRYLHEDPWERLAALSEAVPNICLQMLLRGRNTVGYTPYPETVTEVFVREAAAAGIDIFRIFDALNDVNQMRAAIDAVRSTGTAVAEVALCYTADLSDPGERLYTLDYYLRLAEQIVSAGAHVLAIKDMAGLLRPPAAATLVTALRERFDLPVHLHTHDTAGGQLATLLAAWQAGADAVDGAVASMAGTTSQPPLSAIVAGTDHTDRATGLSLQAVNDLEPYWEAVRRLYAPFESGLPAPTGRVYTHEIPGGQLSNLRQQAIALGLGQRFEDVENAYAAANQLLGRLIKVTPSSKAVGDLALQLVGTGVSSDDFASDPGKYDLPDSVIGFLRGELGDPPGGWPEPFRTAALAGRRPASPPAPLTDDGRSRPGRTAAGSAQPAPISRTYPGLHRAPRYLRRRLPASHPGVSLRPAGRSRVRRRPRTGGAATIRHPGRLRPRRPWHAHRDRYPQRTASPCHRPRPERRGDREDRRESRPLDPGACCGPVRRYRDPPGDGGKPCNGRAGHRDHRGHEDGSGHHRAAGRHRGQARYQPSPARRRRRPPLRHQLSGRSRAWNLRPARQVRLIARSPLYRPGMMTW
jgi:pyruvate/oxaloacetate carboxyltransferase